MPKYLVDFEFLYTNDADDEGKLASTEVDIEREPKTQEEFNEISKALFRQIEDCRMVRVLKVYENSEMIQGLTEILNKNAIKVDDDPSPYRI